MLRHKEGKLKTDFKATLGRWPTTPPATSACRTSARRPGGAVAGAGHRVDIIERCSGHDGTYAVKKGSTPSP